MVYLRGPRWVCSSIFSRRFLHTHTGSVDGIGWNFPNCWIGATGNFFAKSTTNSPPPSSTGSSRVPLWAVSDPSLVDEVKEEMDASCSLLQSTFSEAAVGCDGFTADPWTPPDLQS